MNRVSVSTRFSRTVLYTSLGIGEVIAQRTCVDLCGFSRLIRRRMFIMVMMMLNAPMDVVVVCASLADRRE